MERVVEQVVFPEKFPRMQNVAAYARVSSGKDAMLHSLSAQVSYYSRMIQQTPDGNTVVFMQTRQSLVQKIPEDNFKSCWNAAEMARLI